MQIATNLQHSRDGMCTDSADYVTLNNLSRDRDQSYAGQMSVSMDLTAANETSDNVTLIYRFGNQTTDAYWRLQIVLNESITTVLPWEHDIGLGNDTAGQFGGTVSNSFQVKGASTVWIILWSVYKGSAAMLLWASEKITVY